MTPLDKLRAFYAARCPHRKLEEDLGNCLAYGFLFSTPKYIIAGKPVDRNAAEPLIEDPSYSFDPDRWNLNTWYVFAYAGEWGRFFTALPYKMRFVAFHRRQRIRFYDFDRIYIKCSAHKTPFSARS